MEIQLPYGRGTFPVHLPDSWDVTLLQPGEDPGLADEVFALHQALQQPMGTPPLRELVRETDTVAIVFSPANAQRPRAAFAFGGARACA